MDRVHTLLQKLQSQLEQNCSAQELLHTSEMLHAEILLQAGKNSTVVSDKVSIIAPAFHSFGAIENEADKEENTERIVEVLQVDEREIEAELEQMKKKAESVNALTAHSRPDFEYDPIEDIPTLAAQAPVSEATRHRNELPFEYPESLNDRLKQVKIELSQALTSAPIKDLKKAIGVNDRFLFINELFRGDEAMYERSIKTIQNFSIYAEAEFWIRRELKVKIGWLDADPVVKQFDQLVKRRFLS
jgi:hypothetical protein